jgi:hypothetical protein
MGRGVTVDPLPVVVVVVVATRLQAEMGAAALW